ncbi:MAG TPA: HAMP domain-containing sensor histidine kinase [Cyclobacteriaceae bacterium]|nr:HAMP domain-containing sensor histidine kinase [Cyclobacteriaceae bacterium]
MIVTLVGILLGTVVMFFAVSKTAKLRVLLLKGPNARRWKALIYMMIFFLVGYGISVALVILNKVGILLMVTGAVFFVGAFFVLLVVITAKSDIERIKDASAFLEIKNKELEKINKELDLFAYRVSHDLRGPIASIRGLVDIVRVAESKEEIEFCLEKITSSTVRLDGFIQDILNLSRNSRTDVQVQSVNVCAMVDDVTDSLRYMDSDGRVDLVLNCSQPTIQTDPLRLKIILTNLITNAYKYHDAQKERSIIEVTCANQNQNLVISVKDNGIGILDEHREKIFEMFFRGTDKSVGTGLGLYVVKEIVEKLNGSIDLKTIVGHGSEFIVTLPSRN